VLSGHGLQVGDNNLQINNFPPPAPVSWPHMVGAVPLRADGYRTRAETAELASFGLGGTAVLTQVLSGLGGVGKTQLAAGFARDQWDAGTVDLLVWVTASSRHAVLAAYAQAHAEIIRCAIGHAEQAAASFLAWLHSTASRRWLIVLDDLTDPSDVQGLWPSGPTGQVLVTTRRRDAVLAGQHRRMIEVGLFTAEQALAYLSTRLGSDARGLDQAAELAEDLGRLPLALAQATAFLRDRPAETCASYRRRLADRRHGLAEMFPADALADDYRSTVAVAWSLSIEYADRLPPAGLASAVLLLASVLDPNGVPESVLTSPAALAYLARHRRPRPATEASTTPSAGPFAGSAPRAWARRRRSRRSVPSEPDRALDGSDCRDALAALHRFSLISYDPATPARAVRTHALVQRVVLESAREQLAETVQAAADALLQAWPAVERDADLARAFRDNAQQLPNHDQFALWSSDGHIALFRVGISLGESGLVHAAAGYWQTLTVAAHQHLGPNHAHTLTARSNLTLWQGRAGDPVGAAAALEQLLTDLLRVQGPDHSDTLSTRHNLAYWRGEAGDAAGAAAAFEQLLPDRLRVQGPDHRGTLTARGNLAYWRGKAGDAAGAAAAFEQLLTDFLRVAGRDHPDTLTAQHNLARWQGKAGDAAGAAAAFEQLLADQLRVQGPDHPDTLTARSNLAYWRGEAGDAAGAAAAFEQLLADQLRVQGPDHPDTLITRSNLARWRGEAGNAAGAVAALEQLLPDFLRVLGPDHPETLTIRHNVAYWRGEAGDAAGAAAAFEQLLADQLRVQGPDHPETLTARGNLARWRGEAGDAAGAVAALEQLLPDFQRVLGPDHPHTLTSGGNLAYWRGEAGDAAGAVAALEQLLPDFQRVLGPDHPRTLTTRGNLTYWREMAGDAAEGGRQGFGRGITRGAKWRQPG
jgi:hypothetical protein